MSLSPWMVAAGWSSVAQVYRPAPWDPTKVVAVPGCGAVPGRRRTTSNFDRPKAGYLQSNQDNFDTSDEWRFPDGYDVRAGDVLRVDGGDWLKVAGDPEKKRLIPRRVAFVTTTPAPKIAPGHWSDGDAESTSGLFTRTFRPTF